MPESQYKFVENLQDGIRLDKRSDSMPDGGGTVLDNLTLRDGLMSVDKGYAQYLGTIEGTPQYIFQMRYPAGNADLILVTDQTVYEKISGEWSYAVDQVSNATAQTTTLADDADSGATSVVVANALSFDDDQKVGIRYQSGKLYSVTGVSTGTTTTYTLSSITAWDIGNNLYVEGFSTSGYNGYQTITAISFNEANQTTTVTTSLNSSALGSTGEATGGSRKMQRADQTQEHKTTITNVSSTTITLAAALPGPAKAGARFVKRVELAGKNVLNYIPDSVFIPGWKPTCAQKEGATVLTNVTENPYVIYSGGSGITVRPLTLTKITTSPYATSGSSGSTSLTAFKVKTVCLFRNKLIFGNCTENGTTFTNRVRMSVGGDYENFIATEGGEVYDLIEGDTTINAVRELNKVLIVYKQGSILRGDWIASVDASTRFQTTINSEGAISTHAIVDAPTIHYVVGSKNIYKYDGGSRLLPIGDGIREELFTPQRFANFSMKEFIHCTYDPEFQELSVFYPEGAVKGMRKAYRYSEQNNSWSKRIFYHYFTYAKMLKSVSTVTWNGLRNQWDQYTQPWIGAFFIAEKTHRFMLSQGSAVANDGEFLSTETKAVWDQNQVKKTDYIYPIQWQFDSKDYYVPNSLVRIEHADLYASGDDVVLWYSEDLGLTWNRLKALSAKDSVGQDRVYINKALQRIRFRFKGQSANFQAGWFGFSFNPEFPW